MQRTSVIYIIASAALLIACGQKQGPEPIESAPAPQAGSPSASTQPAPVNAPFMQGQSADPIEQGRSLPLRLSGLNSVEELNRGLARLQDAESRQLFEEAFRKTFTADQSGRNYSDAEAKFQQVLRKSEKSAEAYRGLGYALFNRGQAEAALANYLKAIEISPDYGEAHYAVAFLYAMGDTSKGKLHYQKAMQLGIPDERKLGERFYK